jgi:hypothetical protein
MDDRCDQDMTCSAATAETPSTFARLASGAKVTVLRTVAKSVTKHADGLHGENMRVRLKLALIIVTAISNTESTVVKGQS